MQNEQTIHKLGGDQLKFVNKAIHKKCIARFHWRGGKRHIRPPLNVSAITTIKCIQCWCKCSNTHVHVFMSTFNDNPLCSVHKKISSRRTVFYPNFHQHELPYIILLKWPKGTSDVPLWSNIFLAACPKTPPKDIGVSTQHHLSPLTTSYSDYALPWTVFFTCLTCQLVWHALRQERINGRLE